MKKNVRCVISKSPMNLEVDDYYYTLKFYKDGEMRPYTEIERLGEDAAYEALEFIQKLYTAAGVTLASVKVLAA